MELWLLLIILGPFTYYTVKRSVASITRTPVWILWLVMMAPPLIWIAWSIFNPNNQQPPLALVIVPFVGCPILYWALIQMGRREPNLPPNAQNSGTTDKITGDSVTPNLETPTLPAIENLNLAGKQALIRPINKTEETDLRSCFPWSIYYLENIEYRPQAVLCRGKLRSNPEIAYDTIRDNIKRLFGDRFFILFQESFNGKPFFALVPNPQATKTQSEKQEPLTHPFLAFTLLLMTLFTTTVIGVKVANLANSLKAFDQNMLWQGLPYALSLIAILGIHELGHYLCATYYKIGTTVPYFIPIPFFPGTFGAFIQMRDPVPHRKALFDIGMAGSLSALLITLPLLFWGLAHSSIVPQTDNSNMWNFLSFNPRFSILLSVMSKWAIGSEFVSKMAIKLHPVAIASYIGFLVTAFKLMPVGQLDGGRIVHAMFGQRTSANIGQITRLLMLGLSLVERDLLLWALVLFFMPIADQPALNDVSELDNSRDFWGLAILGLLLLIILPIPGAIANLLQI